MIGVTPYDQISPSKDDHGLLSPLSQGTLHHVFKEGWMWVIAFNNHARSTNPLVSVGMLLNMDLCPPTGMPAEQEFFQFINRFPSISKHFQNARSVRPWTSFDRLQFSSSRSTGARYVLLPHASSFVDPLFSSGLAITMSAINNMAHRIITATRTRNYDPENFEYVNTWIHNGFSYYDRLVRNCYTAWQDFDLWNAYHRTWMLGSLYGVSGLIELLLSYEKTGDLKTFDRFETKPYRGIQAFDVDEYMEIFSYLSENVESVKSGERSSAEASGRIWEYLRGNPFCPEPWDLANPNKRVPGALTLPYLYRLRDWGRNRSPDVVRKYFFNTDVSVGFFKDVASNSLSLSRTLDFSTSDMLRDAFVTWNNEWKRSPASSILPNLLS
jgi:FADH2 O2-dependent halogenase